MSRSRLLTPSPGGATIPGIRFSEGEAERLTGSAAAAFGAPILRFPDYMELVGQLKPELDKAEGFISLERFESITAPGKFVSLQFWRDEESVAKWRNVQKHREAQKRGRGGIFASYRLRIAGVIRDYTLDGRKHGPADSVAAHG